MEGSEEKGTESGAGRAWRVRSVVRDVPEVEFDDVDRLGSRGTVGGLVEVVANDAVRSRRAEVARE